MTTPKTAQAPTPGSERGQAGQPGAEVRLLAMRVNGRSIQVAAPAHWTLLEVLRERLDLVGSKQGCDKGDCGACTVQIDGRPRLACLTLAAQAEGRSVTTVEGLAAPGQACHPLQDAFDRHDAAQCGFCTPGVLVAADAFLRRVQRPVRSDEVREVLAGNLCRCTGYTKILDAVVDASARIFGDTPGEAP